MSAQTTHKTSDAGHEACDLLIHNAYLLTLDERRQVFERGAVAVSANRIVAVGEDADIGARFVARERIDAAGAVVHPGFIDAHNHIVHGTCRGIFGNVERSSGAMNFADWKTDVTREDEYCATALACLELLHNGFTSFVEAGSAFEPDAIAEAATRVGVRVTLAETYLWDQVEIMRHVGSLESKALFARAPVNLERCLEQLGSQLHRNTDVDGHVHGFVCVYGLGTASDELQRAAKAVATEHGVVMQQHEAYVPPMSAALREQLGRSPIVHLAELGVLDSAATLVHMNVLDEEEIAVVAQSGASLVWCPVAYFNLGLPLTTPCRMPELSSMGVNIALGTDGARDCVIGDAALAAHLAARSSGGDISPETVIEMQTINAARAAGLAQLCGSIEVGKRADIVVRCSDIPQAQPANNPVHQLARTCRAGTANTVVVNGRIVLRAGRSTVVDEDEVYAAAQRSVRERMARFGLSPAGLWPVTSA